MFTYYDLFICLVFVYKPNVFLQDINKNKSLNCLDKFSTSRFGH